LFALWTVVPLANIFIGLYYGIAKHKSQEKPSNAKDQSLAKAVYNHSKKIASEVKPAIDEYKDRHQNTANSTVIISLSEDEIYEKVMVEIEEDKKVKSTWAKALAQSDGNESKSTSLYIQMRVKVIKSEIRTQKKDKEIELEIRTQEKHKEMEKPQSLELENNEDNYNEPNKNMRSSITPKKVDFDYSLFEDNISDILSFAK
jgi:hypothetical protein